MGIVSHQFCVPKETDTLVNLSSFIIRRALVISNRVESRPLELSLLFIFYQLYVATTLFLIVEGQDRIRIKNLLEISYCPLANMSDYLSSLLLTLLRQLLLQGQLIACTIYLFIYA